MFDAGRSLQKKIEWDRIPKVRVQSSEQGYMCSCAVTDPPQFSCANIALNELQDTDMQACLFCAIVD